VRAAPDSGRFSQRAVILCRAGGLDVQPYFVSEAMRSRRSTRTALDLSAANPGGSKAAVLAVQGHLDAMAILALCEQLQSLIDSGADLVICDVGMLDACDLVTIDALARLTLIVQRLGCTIRVTGASDQLAELIAFVGLNDVLQVYLPDDDDASGPGGA
jgi:ABC-type transporter Mla MlaB component